MTNFSQTFLKQRSPVSLPISAFSMVYIFFITDRNLPSWILLLSKIIVVLKSSPHIAAHYNQITSHFLR